MSWEGRNAYSYADGFELPERIYTLRHCAELLCDHGPAYCAGCESQCGYGRRFLQIARDSGMTEGEILTYRDKAEAERRQKQAEYYQRQKARKALLSS